jgi:cellobiose-specific phosphotransferase system component IIA
MFQHFQDHWYDTGSWIQYAWMWWFDGTVGGGSWLEFPDGGNFWPTYPLANYYKQETTPSNVMSAIDSFLHQGYGCGIHIFDGGHAITVWGFSYDPSNPKYYTGLYVTDSDDKKYLAPPAPDDLRYETVAYDTSNNWWYFTSGLENGWHISDVQALLHFPNQAPVADAGGPYYCTLGGTVLLDASASDDPDGYLFSAGIVKYEWDINNDGVYEISTTNPTYSYMWTGDALPGTVTLRVTDLLGGTSTATTTITTFGVELTLSPYSRDIVPGNTGTYDLTIKNDGNAVDTFDLSLTGLPVTWTYLFSSTAPAVPAFGTMTVQIYITPYKDWSTTPGDYPFTVTAASEQAVLYGLTATESKLGNVHVLPFHEVKIKLTPASVTVKPGQAANYTIEVTNLGNVRDSFSISLLFDDFGGTYKAFPTSIQSAWTTIDKPTLTMDPGQSDVAKLTITVPQNWAGMQDTTYKFTATATCQADPTANASDSANLIVKTTKQSMAEYVKLEIQWLQNNVISLHLKADVNTGLLDKLGNATMKVDQAIQWINQGNVTVANNMLTAANNILDAFINQVNGQKGKAIRLTDALALIDRAHKIQTEIQQAISQPIDDP